MNASILQLELKEGAGILTIHRPEALNALNSQFFIEFKDRIQQVSRRTDIGVLIITGSGKAFVAGADIAEMAGMNEEQARQFSTRGQEAFGMLESLPVPVIAAINGYALGGGCELATACDIRIASEQAKFGQPEVSLGLIPGFAATQRLPRLVGLSNALHLLLTGDTIPAAEALRIGLVQKVVPHENLMQECLSLASKILSRGPKAIRLVKSVTRRGMNLGFETGAALESQGFGTLFGNEGTIGMQAFLEKRSPSWR